VRYVEKDGQYVLVLPVTAPPAPPAPRAMRPIRAFLSIAL
jgi:hypothetical protein